MSTRCLNLDPQTYQRHRLHTQDRHWAETNCYVDLWIELLHAWDYEPLAALPFTVGIDFEGDQWTFFKFPHGDLLKLYNLDVQELAIWRPLVDHLDEQLSRGRPVLIELDSYYLPDTAGTAYQLAHVKSTVAAAEIDIPGKRLGYFHGQGYYELSGDDFDRVLRITECTGPEYLPPYAEIAKSRGPGLTGMNLVAASVALLREHLQRLPSENPFETFLPRFTSDLQWLTTADLEQFHQYSFATLRQFGACFELTTSYLQWLRDHGVDGLEAATQAYTALSAGAKSLQFNLARAMARKRQLDPAPVQELARHWDIGVTQLRNRFLEPTSVTPSTESALQETDDLVWA